MRVLLAGAGGVAGRALLPLLANHAHVIALDRPEVPLPSGVPGFVADIRDWRALRAAFAEAGPVDAVVDTIMSPVAAISSEDRARSDFDVNVAGTWALATEAISAGVRRFVYLSTLNVYGDLETGTHLEPDDLFLNRTVDVAEPYGLSKRIAEMLFDYLCATRNVHGVALRLDSLHVPGEMERRGVHIEDVADAIRLALDVPLSGFHVCNLTADPARNSAPNEVARELLGWTPKHVFELRRELEDWTQPIAPPLGGLRDMP